MDKINYQSVSYNDNFVQTLQILFTFTEETIKISMENFNLSKLRVLPQQNLCQQQKKKKNKTKKKKKKQTKKKNKTQKHNGCKHKRRSLNIRILNRP